MKSIIALAIAFTFTFAPVQQSKASDITTSVVVGVVVAHYAGTLAGVAASSVLAGAALITAAGKEVAVKSAQNDIQAFLATGELSLNLQNSIHSIQSLDESISQEEAMDLIIEATNA